MKQSNQTPYRQKDFVDAEDSLFESLGQIKSGRLDTNFLKSKKTELNTADIDFSRSPDQSVSSSFVQSHDMTIGETIPPSTIWQGEIQQKLIDRVSMQKDAIPKKSNTDISNQKDRKKKTNENQEAKIPIDVQAKMAFLKGG